MAHAGYDRAPPDLARDYFNAAPRHAHGHGWPGRGVGAAQHATRGARDWKIVRGCRSPLGRRERVNETPATTVDVGQLPANLRLTISHHHFSVRYAPVG